jgi:hypothetical protein
MPSYKVKKSQAFLGMVHVICKIYAVPTLFSFPWLLVIFTSRLSYRVTIRHGKEENHSIVFRTDPTLPDTKFKLDLILNTVNPEIQRPPEIVRPFLGSL